MITAARPAPTSPTRATKRTSAVAVQASPRTAIDASAWALGTWLGGAIAAAGASRTVERASDTAIMPRGSTLWSLARTMSVAPA